MVQVRDRAEACNGIDAVIRVGSADLLKVFVHGMEIEQIIEEILCCNELGFNIYFGINRVCIDFEFREGIIFPHNHFLGKEEKS